MKRFLLITCLFLSAAAVNAQVSLNAYGGYTFKDKINFDNARAYINDGFQWGLGLEYALHQNKSLELKYLRMDTHTEIYKLNGTRLNPTNTKTAVNYVLFGGNNYFGDGFSKTVPYAGADIGVAILEGNSNSSTAFAWDIKAGVKIHTSSAISIKLQAYLQSAVHEFGTDYWYGYWGEVYAVPDYKTLLQFGLSAALCFDFKHKK